MHLAPWELPSDAFGSQRLYRVSFEGPQGEGSFRITLRLASPERYQIQAVDPVGRALWALDVTAERGLWLDHRNRVSCVFEGSFDLTGIPLGPFPLLSLPALLMGRLPAVPAGPAASAASAAASEPWREGRTFELLDEAGRRWVVEPGGDGTLEGWTLWEEGRPSVWYMRRDNWAYLSDRERGGQVRWREVLREPLAGALATLEPPPGYHESSCRELYAPG